ncbi:Protein DGCR14-like protein [Zancudomyces culisetae]|uniref:Protein DGCR14-like protein n=1 Tax=Zancudomyces culisetae TaxID=1213189 RepID=A0A1R1PC52_ZANCU|nr:Protein DGCR14-like protein [Zancudomyces culisetae]|eukprot:OMH78548.1 Protein DGCR14-like protein [Zancudomyces culisetae]
MSKTPVLNSTKTNSHNRSNHNNSTALVHTHPPSPSPSSSLNQITTTAAAAATTSINPYPVLKVLPEEQFVSAIDHIVERDFFPHLAALKKIEQNDPTISSPNILAYTDTHTTRRGPRHDTHNMVTVTSHHAGINTPDSTTSNIHGNPLDPSFSATTESLDTENLSLNQFLDSFTTQDNSSFAKLVEKSSAERKRKYFWLYGDGTSSTNTQGLLESPHTQKSISDNSNNTSLITRDIPDNSKVITTSPSNQSLNTWNFKARNALMYPPDTLDSQFSINPRAKTTSIVHKNTRFPKDFKSAPSNEKLVFMAQEIGK